MKENILVCIICNEEFEDDIKFNMHLRNKHNINRMNYVIKYLHNGIHPVCKCGCGVKVKWRTIKFNEYLAGHVSRIKNNFNTEKSINNSSETRRKQYKDGTRIQWNKNKKWNECYDEKTQKYLRSRITIENENKSKAISDKLIGKKHSIEHLENLKNSRIKYMKENPKYKKSEIELKFELFLKSLDFQYEIEFSIQNCLYIFDFHITNTNILFEVDGDYFHVNPMMYETANYKFQIDNQKRDILKQQWCDDNGYILYRFWEHDINVNPEDVILKLIEIKKSLKYTLNEDLSEL